jgi:heme exporter protein D
MQFDSLSNFFAMGGHGLYVWLAYGAVTLFLVGYTGAMQRRRRRIVAELKFQVLVAEESEANAVVNPGLNEPTEKPSIEA